MPATIQVDIPDEILEHYKNIGDITRKVFEDMILMERHQGNLSLGRAAELLGISYTECYELLVERGLPIANVSQEERDESYERLRTFMNTYRKP